MSEHSPLGRTISRSSLLLAAFALVTTAMIATTYQTTKDRIAEQERIARAKALLEIVPRERHDNAMLDSTIAVADTDLLRLREPGQIFIARQQGQAVTFIVPSRAPDGYSGDIDIIVGINVDGTVAGVRILKHSETPGLGDKVETKKSSWVTGFNGKYLGNPRPERWKVKKDKGVFDQFTGATITPRAVTKAVLQALQYFDQHRDQLLQQAAEEAQHG